MLGGNRGEVPSERPNSDGGGGGGGGGGRSAGEGKKYSALLPHLLELVAYHSGVEAIEVCSRAGE